MAKISGVGSKAYFGGYDLSGDMSSLGGIEMSAAVQDVTSIDDTGMERIFLRRDGKMSFNALFNAVAGRSHPVLSALPTTEIEAMWAQAPTVGAICAMLAAKQVNYVATLAADGSMKMTAEAQAAVGAGVEWGQLVTAGKREDTTATASGTGADLGIPPAETAITITSASAASPTSVLTASAHGYTTGDSVIIAGASKAALNDEFTITVVDSTHFTVAVDLTSGASSGGTVTRTSTRSGWAAQLQTFLLTGTSSTITLQTAPKNASGSFADVTGGAFTAATAIGGQRIAGASNALLQRYVRVKSAGTFTDHIYAVGVTRL